MNNIEIVGYAAMAFTVLSFVPKQIKKVRIINLIGCIIFIAYGILLGLKWPIIITNAMVAIIQIYHLFFAKNKQQSLVQE